MQVFHYQEETYISKYKFQREVFLPVFIAVTKQKMVKNGVVNNRIAEHHFRGRNIEATGTLRHVLPVLQTVLSTTHFRKLGY